MQSNTSKTFLRSAFILLLAIVLVAQTVSCAKHVHAYGNATVVKEATFTEEGVEQRVCEEIGRAHV